jgi:hypothetical protein
MGKPEKKETSWKLYMQVGLQIYIYIVETPYYLQSVYIYIYTHTYIQQIGEKLVLEKYNGWRRPDLSVWGQGPVEGSYKHDNESSVSVTDQEILD